MDLHAALTAPSAAGIEFLKTELSLANTFLDIADPTAIPRIPVCRKPKGKKRPRINTPEHRIEERRSSLKQFRVLPARPRRLFSQ